MWYAFLLINPLSIVTKNQEVKLVPISHKISKSNLKMKYDIFSGNINNINIYKDNYSIILENNQLHIDILLQKGVDSNQNHILFYKLSTIIPIKFNSNLLENNIISLCNFLVKKELSSL